MSLSASKSTLESAIRQAFSDINRKGAADGSDPEANIISLASALAAAIHGYVTSADVDITTITTTVLPGIPVSVPPSIPVTTSPGPTTHTGFGKLV